MLAEIKQLTPSATMFQPSDLSDPCYLAFSNAIQGKSSYGQTVYISGIYLSGGSKFQALYCQSSKQILVAFSYNGAEILAAATSADRGSMIAQYTQQLFGSPIPLPFIVTLDSNGLFSIITTLQNTKVMIII